MEAWGEDVAIAESLRSREGRRARELVAGVEGQQSATVESERAMEYKYHTHK